MLVLFAHESSTSFDMYYGVVFHGEFGVLRGMKYLIEVMIEDTPGSSSAKKAATSATVWKSLFLERSPISEVCV
jgi:hypothetical protein